MSAPLPAAFRGAGAIVLEKRRSLVRVPLWLALPSGVLASFLARINHADPAALAWVVLVALGVAAVFGPLFAASYVTLSPAQIGSRSRREELLSLPIGRLAIPSGVLVASLGITLASSAAFLAGFSWFLGRGKVLEALLTGPIEQDMPFTATGRLEIHAILFALTWAMTALAHFSNFPLLLLSLLGLGLGALPAVSGYDNPTALAYAKIWMTFLGGYVLLAPFVLYARSPHHWATVRSTSRFAPQGSPASHDGPAMPAVLASLAALGILGVAGFGKGVVGALVLGAVFMVRAQRRQPPVERRRVSNLAVSLALGLVFAAPPTVLGLWTDARQFELAARPVPENLVASSLSPDGKHLAAAFRLGDPNGITRVLVVDLTGREPVRALPPRCGVIEDPCCWSKDGRYLAVHDCALGRLVPAGATDRMLPWQSSTWNLASEVSGFDQFMERQFMSAAFSALGTWVLDTQTGSLVGHDLLVLAPGWSAPEELLTLAPHSLGGCDLVDGRGRRTTLEIPDAPTEHAGFAVDGYTGAGAELVVVGVRVRVPGDGTIAAIGSWTPWTVATKETLEKDVDPRKARKRWDIAFARGDRRVTVEGCRGPTPVWLDPSTVLLSEEEGSVRHDLETGERQLVRPKSLETHGGTFVRRYWLSADVTGYRTLAPTTIARTKEGFSRLDLRTGDMAPLPSFPGFEPEAVAGTCVLGKLAGKLAVSENGSAPRPVF